MCGLVGYVGTKNCVQPVFEGLRKLEYRGYDCAGFASVLPQQNHFFLAKAVGGLDRLYALIGTAQEPAGYAGVGHTRWATHGTITVENAHPHTDCTGSVVVAHNGIIENYLELKLELIKRGHQFNSSTDTEVIAHLIEEALAKTLAPIDAIQQVVKQLSGAYALIILFTQAPETLFIARHRSPLYVGSGEHELFVASDSIAFDRYASRVLSVPDNSFGYLTNTGISLFALTDATQLTPVFRPLQSSESSNYAHTYAHEMLREIYEEPTAIRATLHHLEKEAQNSESSTFHAINHLFTSAQLIACGTSWHAGGIGALALQELADIPAISLRASEFRYGKYFKEPNTTHLFISQSGETADTLEAVRMVHELKEPTIALTNVPTSSIAQEANHTLCTHAGREIAVASTKAFSAQLTALIWYAQQVGTARKIPAALTNQHSTAQINEAANILEQTLEQYRQPIQTIHAPYYAQFDRFLFVGRGVGYWIAAEAALKLKEISYCFAEAHPAGELKHGVIALIDAKTPTCLISSTDQLLYRKLISTAHEIKSRNGHLLVIAAENQTELIDLADVALTIPPVAPLLFPLVATGLLHLFAYYSAVQRNCPIDRPRNLAKSVTVE